MKVPLDEVAQHQNVSSLLIADAYEQAIRDSLGPSILLAFDMTGAPHPQDDGIRRAWERIEFTDALEYARTYGDQHTHDLLNLHTPDSPHHYAECEGCGGYDGYWPCPSIDLAIEWACR